MGRGKSVDTPAAQARRMPFVAKIKREDPFRPNDAQEIYTMCRRIAASSEYLARAGENAGFLVYRFTTWAKARAMQHWIDRSGIAHRPMPSSGRHQRKSPKGSDRRSSGDWRRARCARSCRPTGAPGTQEIRTSRLSMPPAPSAWRLVVRTMRCSTRSRERARSLPRAKARQTGFGSARRGPAASLRDVRPARGAVSRTYAGVTRPSHR